MLTMAAGKRSAAVMYLARFSYDVRPVDRQRAIEFISREVEAARGKGLNARLLVPLTRDWMHAFSDVLTAPPCVEILRFD
jgi:hypothetical protein